MKNQITTSTSQANTSATRKNLARAGAIGAAAVAIGVGIVAPASAQEPTENVGVTQSASATQSSISFERIADTKDGKYQFKIHQNTYTKVDHNVVAEIFTQETKWEGQGDHGRGETKIVGDSEDMMADGSFVVIVPKEKYAGTLNYYAKIRQAHDYDRDIWTAPQKLTVQHVLNTKLTPASWQEPDGKWNVGTLINSTSNAKPGTKVSVDVVLNIHGKADTFHYDLIVGADGKIAQVNPFTKDRYSPADFANGTVAVGVAGFAPVATHISSDDLR